MNTLPSGLKQIAFFLERLPGIGEKTANRLAFHLLRLPDNDLKDFSENIRSLKQKTKLCRVCLNLTEDEVCAICADNQRNKKILTVVEDVVDLISLETGNIYQGVYHILHGRIDPLNHVSSEDIHIDKLLGRVEKDNDVREIILATNPDMEGEATAMFIRNKLKEMKKKLKKEFKISRLGYGLPMGANLEYADYMTLKKAIENRNEY